MWIWFVIVPIVIIVVLTIVVLQAVAYKSRKNAEYEMAQTMENIREKNRVYAAGANDSIEAHFRRHDAVEQGRIRHADMKNGAEVAVYIMSEKAVEAEQSGIIWEVFDVVGIASMFEEWEKSDVVSFLANLINNAIESCCRVEDVEMRSIQIVRDSETLWRIRNSKPTNQHPLENNFSTSKEDASSHGFGTRIIQRTADRYGVILDYKDEGEEFVITIRMSNS